MNRFFNSCIYYSKVHNTCMSIKYTLFEQNNKMLFSYTQFSRLLTLLFKEIMMHINHYWQLWVDFFPNLVFSNTRANRKVGPTHCTLFTSYMI